MRGIRLVVKAHDPVSVRVRVGAGLLLALVVGWALYTLGGMRAGHDFSSARADRREALNQLQRSERENRELRERVALAERSSQVDQQTHGELRQTLVGLNDEILRLREELAFYRGIVSPADARRGLQVQRFRVEPVGELHWRFRLTLIQAMQHDRQAQGTARVVIVGAQDGTLQRRSLADLGEHPVDGIPYDFRYFQEFDGDILLPQGFVPDRVEVELVPRNERDGRVARVFDWPSA